MAQSLSYSQSNLLSVARIDSFLQTKLVSVLFFSAISFLSSSSDFARDFVSVNCGLIVISVSGPRSY